MIRVPLDKQQHRSVVALMAFAVPLVLLIWAAAASHAATPIPICTAAGDQQFPAIYGDVIVWEDYRDYASSSTDIYAYVLSTDAEIPICTAPTEQWSPSIWGDVIVWQDSRNAVKGQIHYDIYSYDLNLGAESPVYQNAREKWLPRIYESTVVWEEKISTYEWDIFSIQLGGDTPQTICSAYGVQQDACIFGNTVVWHDLRNDWDFDVFAYDMLLEQEMPVASWEFDQWCPDIWGSRIVWEDYRNGDGTTGDIFMYDLSTGIEIAVCADESDQWYPSICGDIIVWEDYRNGDADIFMYDLTTNTEYPLVVDEGDQRFPRIHGSRVVYQNQSGGQYDIYMVYAVPPNYSEVTAPNEAKAYPDASPVRLSGVVTASFPGSFYIEHPRRSSAVEVRWKDPAGAGSAVTISGFMGTEDGERFIQADSVEATGSTAVPRPVWMRNQIIGGGPLNVHTPGVTGGTGLHNLGLLIRTSGRVTAHGDGFFYISDGSIPSGGTVEMISGSLAKPAIGNQVAVVGIATTAANGSAIHGAVRVRQQSDIAEL